MLSVATLPVAWVAGRRYGGRTVAWVTLALLASAPFAVYYATEGRMYSLVMFLTACGFVAVGRALERPRPGNLIAVAVVGAALLYSQYWALYLLGALGVWLLWQAWRGRPEQRHNARWVVGALLVSALAFVPWVPIFLYQSAHTGTPWSKPPNFAAVIDSITGFGDNQATHQTAGTNQGRLLALGYFTLGRPGLVRPGPRPLAHRTRPANPSGGPGVAFVVVVTLFAAIAGGILTGSAFSPRYASVVFVPLILLVALGSLTLLDARMRAVAVGVLAVAGLVAAAQNIWTYRSQAPQIAAVLNSQARPGDIVALCPDQLGPAVYQVVTPGRFDLVTYPRGTGPQYVDWVDYQAVAEASNPATFAHKLEAEAVAGGHTVWLVSAEGYQGFGTKCQILGGDLLTAAGVRGPSVGERQPEHLLRADAAHRVQAAERADDAFQRHPVSPTPGAPPAGLARRAGAVLVAVAPQWVVARLIVLGALGLARLLADRTHPSAAAVARVHQGLLGWDAGWYEGIARFGYGRLGPQSLRFFPLFPLLGRGLGAVPGVGDGPALVLVANAAALVATALLFVLVRRETGDAGLGSRSVWLLCLAPSAFVLVMGYAEGVLLALSVGCFLAVRRGSGRAPWAGRPRPAWCWAAALGLAARRDPTGGPGAGPGGRGGGGPLVAHDGRRRAPAGRGGHAGPTGRGGRLPGWSAAAFGNFWLPLKVQSQAAHHGGLSDPWPPWPTTPGAS